MSTPPAPTDEEMIAWCEDRAKLAEDERIGWGYDPSRLRVLTDQAAMLRAIAARLRAPSAGKSEPPPGWEGER